MWTEIIIHSIAAILGFASSSALIVLKRRRIKAINATRALSVFFLRNLKKLEENESITRKEREELAQEVREWLKFPNALGSETNAAKLVAKIQVSCSPEVSELIDVDRALNSLDQRATERERAPEN